MIRHENLTVLLAGLVTDAGGTLPDALRERARLLKEQLRALSPVVDAFGGRLAQVAGDSLVATFTSPSEAVRCGMALQDATWERNRAESPASQLQLRVSVAGGEVQVDEHGAFGAPVERAGQLADRTPAGAITLDSGVAAVVPAIPLEPESERAQRVAPVCDGLGGPPFGGQHRMGGAAGVARSVLGRSVSSILRSVLGMGGPVTVSAGSVERSHLGAAAPEMASGTSSPGGLAATYVRSPPPETASATSSPGGLAATYVRTPPLETASPTSSPDALAPTYVRAPQRLPGPAGNAPDDLGRTRSRAPHRLPTDVLVVTGALLVVAIAAGSGKTGVPLMLRTLLPALLSLGVGWALATKAGIEPALLQNAGRYGLFPVACFTLLAGAGLDLRLIALSLAAGAAMGIAGDIVRRLVPQAGEVAPPELLGFALPFLALCWQPKAPGLSVAGLVLIGAASARALLAARKAAWKVLAREPWAYAVIAAMVWTILGLQTTHLSRTIGIVGAAAYPLLFAGVGAALGPMTRLGVHTAKAIAIRLGSSLAVVLVIIAALQPARPVVEVLVICSLAPPAVLPQIGDAGMRPAYLSAGVAVSLVAMAALVLIPW